MFYYETELEWKKAREGQIKGAGLPALSVGAPPEFQGRDGVWSPEHLFVAALNSCYMLTFLAIAEFSKVPVVSFSSTAKGTLAKVKNGSYQITEIMLKPKVAISCADDLDRMARIMEKAKENCFVSNSIKSAITVEPEVTLARTASAALAAG